MLRWLAVQNRLHAPGGLELVGDAGRLMFNATCQLAFEIGRLAQPAAELLSAHGIVSSPGD